MGFPPERAAGSIGSTRRATSQSCPRCNSTVKRAITGWAVFFITGRPGLLRNATQRNLRAAGYDQWNGLMMKTRGYRTESVIAFKTSARRQIAAQGYTIVLNMGDQESDLTGGYAERTFKVPNPFYYRP